MIVSNNAPSIWFNREEGKRVLPNEICVAIFTYLSSEELRVSSCVSEYWRELSTCNAVWRPILNKITSSVITLLTHPESFCLFLCNSNGIFNFSLPSNNVDESLYQCMVRNRVDVNAEEDLIDSFKDLVKSCELGIPKLRIYKSLKDSFMIALSILIGPLQKNKYTQSEIFFINSSESGLSNWDENMPRNLPQMNGYTRNIKDQRVSYNICRWNAPENFLSSKFFTVFNREMERLCPQRLEVLEPSHKQQAIT